MRGFIEIGGHAAALGKAHGDLVGRAGIAAQRRGPQARRRQWRPATIGGLLRRGLRGLLGGARATEPVTSAFDAGGSGALKAGIAVTGRLYLCHLIDIQRRLDRGGAGAVAGLAGAGAGSVGGASKEA